jgi:hypothetical protein
VQEPLEVAWVQVEGPHRVEHGREQRVVDRGTVQAGEEPLAPGAEGGGLASWVQGRCEVVDELVGVAGKAVQGVHVAALPARQQQGGQVVGAAIAGVQLPAALIGRRKRPRLRGGGPSPHRLPPMVTMA